MALSAAQLSPHFLSPLFSSLQASSTSSPDPSARDSYFTENRSNQRPQAPTTASGVLPLPSSKTATYQQHFISRWVTIPPLKTLSSRAATLPWFFSASLAASSLWSVPICPQRYWLWCPRDQSFSPLISYLFFTNTHFQSELILSQGFHTPPER